MTTEHIAALQAVGNGPDDLIPIAETALRLAALNRPRVSLDRYFAHLEALVSSVAQSALDVTSAGDAAGLLSDTLAGEFDYMGDDLTYDDLQNANLMRVIDRRKGLPVALGILYIHAARRQGWRIEGMAFPGHFLLRLEHDGARSVIDPFHKGVVRSTHELRDLLKTVAGADAELKPAHYETVSDREILLRLQNNIKLRQLQQGAMAKAAVTVEHMTMIAPKEYGLLRELGLIRANAGQVQGALQALEMFLESGAHASQKHEIAAVIQQLRSRLN